MERGEQMKRLITVIATTGVLATGGVGSALAGGSSGKGHETISASCTVLGNVTVHVTSGASAWIGDSHYVLLRLQGTFTPTSGPAESFTKTYGRKRGFGQSYACTGSETDAGGTFSFTATIARNPNR
jgi:hypothetical protein